MAAKVEQFDAVAIFGFNSPEWFIANNVHTRVHYTHMKTDIDVTPQPCTWRDDDRFKQCQEGQTEGYIDFITPGRIGTGGARSTDNNYYYSLNDRWRDALRATVTAYLVSPFGTHELKGGFELEWMKADNTFAYTGNIYYVDRLEDSSDSSSGINYYWRETGGQLYQRNVGESQFVFLQDTWEPVSGLTIDLGFAYLDDGSIGAIKCVTPAPASDQGELRTILLLGDLGSIDNQPFEVEIAGNILSLDGRRNFLGSNVRVTRLERGPEIVHADIVPEDQWELGKQASIFPFGSGSGCPPSTQQVIRVTWTGGITKFGGGEVDQTEQSAYRILVEGDDGQLMRIEPFAMGDLGDGDNNHKLCLDTRSRPLGVEFPEGLVTDPREDFNSATSIELP